MKMVSTKRRKRNSPFLSPIIIVIILVVAANAILAATFLAMSIHPHVHLVKDAADRVVVIINPATDLDGFKVSVNGVTTAGTLDVVKTVSVDGLTVTFVDAGSDGKMTSNDYFTVSRTERNAASNGNVLTIVWVGGLVTRNVATIEI